MNKIEKFLYNIVKKNARFTKNAKKMYQLFLSWVPQKKINTEYNFVYKEGYFFGFHDKTPWSPDGSKILSHRFVKSKKLTLPKNNQAIDVGYFVDDSLDSFVKVGETLSWNWQQGSMLQWLNDEQIIYNFWDGNNNISVIKGLDGREIKRLQKPIGAISNNKFYYASYSFERLNIGMYGYGYQNENDNTKIEKIPELDGLYIGEIEKGRAKLIVTIKKIADLITKNHQNKQLYDDAYHFFTHVLFSPDDKRISFFYRKHLEGRALTTWLITCDLNGNNIKIFPSGGFCSHYSWINSNKIIIYGNINGNTDGYYFLDVSSDKYEMISNTLYNEDGHPQYCDSVDSVITDTYPNRFRIQELSAFNLKNNEKKVLGKFRSPLKFRDYLRCDLHPRWSPKGDSVCVDTTFSGERSILVLFLNKETIK